MVQLNSHFVGGLMECQFHNSMDMAHQFNSDLCLTLSKKKQ